MKKICFGNGIKAQNNKMCNLTVSIKGSLKEVYRFPKELKNISNCFNNCANLSVFNANIPNSIENMSNSFNSCKNLFKDISIPSNCTNMAYAFSNVPASGTRIIPRKVINMTGAFENSKINEVTFNNRNSTELSSVINMASAFSNSSLENITLIDNLKIGNAYRAFSTCPIERIWSDLNVDNGCEMFKASNIKSVQNIKSNSANSMFLSSVYLNKVGTIESNNFNYTFDNCRSMKEIGNITGNLAFKHTFRNCGVGDTGAGSYSNVIYLKPTSLSFLDEGSTSEIPTDRNFLYSHALRIYGRGHGLENELNFINAHAKDGTYISGYCDPSQFVSGKYTGVTGTTIDLCIPEYYRTNLLDATTKTSFNVSNSFQGNTFNSVYLFGGNITNAFKGAIINSLHVKSSIKNIHENAFNSAKITNAVLPDLINIKNSAFFNANIINELKTFSISNVGNKAFFNAKIGNFNTLGFSRKMFDICDDAFGNSTVNISNYDLKNIGNNAFRNSSISEVSIVGSGTLGSHIFNNTQITDLDVPKYGTIAESAFSGMIHLQNLQIYDLNISQFGGTFPTSLKKVIFGNSEQNSISTQKLSSVQEMYFSNGLTTVKDNQFRNLGNIKKFVTTSIGTIGNNAFANFGNTAFQTFKDFGGHDVIIKGNVNDNAFNNSSIKRLSVGYNYRINNGSLVKCNSLEYLSCNISQGFSGYAGSSDSKGYSYVNSGSYHIGRLFGAILNTPTSVGPNDYLLWTDTPDSTTYSYYLNRDKIPQSLKKVDIISDWGEYSFKGLNTLTDIGYVTDIWAHNPQNRCSYKINNIFKDCNNLINISMRMGVNHKSNCKFIYISPNIISASNSANYNISYRYNISNFSGQPGNAISDIRGNLSYNVTSNNSFSDICNYTYFNNVSAYNYSTNITILPRIQHLNSYSSQSEYYGRYLYMAGNMFKGYTLKTDKVALSSPAIWNGVFLHNDYTYYCPEDTILYGASGTYNNCTFYIDQVNTISSNFAWFNNFTNSKIYFNGIDSSNFDKFNEKKGTGTQMKIGDKNGQPFNVPTLINDAK